MPLTLSQIWVYPIKSLGGVPLAQATAQARGLAHDRRWMLVRPDGSFLTQRQYPHMAALKLAIAPTGLDVWHIDHPQDRLHIPAKPATTARIQVQVWQSSVSAAHVSAQADAWFSQMLGTPCHLVYMDEAAARQTDPQYAQSEVSFADGYPFLLMGQAGLDDLQRRMGQPLPMSRFRPTLVFEGGAPYAEDTWGRVRIGALTFRGVKPCGRCVITSIDQDRGQPSASPLPFLATYRRWNHGVVMGQNLVAETLGILRVGDVVQPLSTQPDVAIGA